MLLYGDRSERQRLWIEAERISVMAGGDGNRDGGEDIRIVEDHVYFISIDLGSDVGDGEEDAEEDYDSDNDSGNINAGLFRWETPIRATYNYWLLSTRRGGSPSPLQ